MDPKKLLDQFLGSPGAGAAAGGLAGGALAGLLTSKKGRKSAKKLATYGGLAALGVMAYQAWQKKGSGGQQPPSQPLAVSDAAAVQRETQAATQAAFLPPPEDAEATRVLSQHLLEAMISAARADGVLDAAEREKIDARVSGLPAEDRQELFALMSQDADPHRIAALARSPQEATELYLVSALAIEPDHWTEQAYLETLRRALNIEPSLARELEAAAAGDR